MKKKLFSIITSIAIVASLCVPCLAFAEESPKSHYISATDTAENGITITISTWITEADWEAGVEMAGGQDPELIIEECDQIASNVPSDSNIVVSFEAYTRPSGWIDYIADYTYDVVLSGGGLLENINEKCTLYVEHHSGKTEYFTGIVADDEVSFDSQLSYFTLVDGWPNGKRDDSNVSPKTDDASIFPVIFGISTIIVGGSVAYAMIRRGKKVTK